MNDKTKIFNLLNPFGLTMDQIKTFNKRIEQENFEGFKKFVDNTNLPDEAKRELLYIKRGVPFKAYPNRPFISDENATKQCQSCGKVVKRLAAYSLCFSCYHKHRYLTDQEYREKKRQSALDYKTRQNQVKFKQY